MITRLRRSRGPSPYRRALVLVLLVATLSLASTVSGWAQSRTQGTAASPGTPAGRIPISTVGFLVEEILANPTASSIAISVVPAEPCEVVVEYGRAPTGFTSITSPLTAPAGQRTTVDLTGLQADERYIYRVRTRKANEGVFGIRPTHDFQTRRAPGGTFSFAFGADSHGYSQWAQSDCGGETGSGLLNFRRTIENVLAEDVDFFLTAGDEAQTHCVTCVQCDVDAESAGAATVQSLREAELRYQTLLSPELYGPLLAEMPLFYALGNHDGETGFGDASGSCMHFDTTRAYSEAARLAFLPNPAAAYPGGNPEGSYFSFEWGDALFCVIDVHRYTTEYPLEASDWTLGDDQLSWLWDTLGDSDRHWKFVIGHHLVGGAPDLQHNTCYYYGRGGLRSTWDGGLWSFFSGEQQTIQTIMENQGAQAFLYGHDHVSICGEKRGLLGWYTGVHYIQGGQSGGTAPEWLGDPSFQRQMDWDDDGDPDYYDDPVTHSTHERGFFRVTVEDTTRVVFDYVVTDAGDALSNGRVLYSYEITD